MSATTSRPGHIGPRKDPAVARALGRSRHRKDLLIRAFCIAATLLGALAGGALVFQTPEWQVLSSPEVSVLGGAGAGAVAGRAIPDWLALDFAVPITFIALIAPALRDLAHVAAAVTAVVAALALAGLPYSSGLLVAALLGMGAGALVEARRAGRQP